MLDHRSPLPLPSFSGALSTPDFLLAEDGPNKSCNVALKLLTLPPPPPSLSSGVAKSISPLAIECRFLGAASGSSVLLFVFLKLGLRKEGVEV